MTALALPRTGTPLSPWTTHRLARTSSTPRSRTAAPVHIAMNRASRQFHPLLKDALHRLRDGVYTDTERDQLERARLDYRDRYAEAQLLVPESVLAASRDLNRVLAAIDATTKRLDRGHPHEGETPDQALLALKAAEPKLRTLIDTMRAEHGTPR